MIFSFARLRSFFNSINELGHCKLFKNWDGSNCFLLRHDVDFDLRNAVDLAKIEAEVGICSTFFVLTSCRTYNVLNIDNRKILREIIELGHEIALHFDPSIYDYDLQNAAKEEAKILSFACDYQVKSISLHNPSVHGEYPIFDGFINAYDPMLFKSESYISDSCYSFRGKNPFEFIKGVKKNSIQILLHPIHYSENGSGYDLVIVESIKRFINQIDTDLSQNSTYSRHVQDSLLNLIKVKQ